MSLLFNSVYDLESENLYEEDENLNENNEDNSDNWDEENDLELIDRKDF